MKILFNIIIAIFLLPAITVSAQEAPCYTYDFSPKKNINITENNPFVLIFEDEFNSLSNNRWKPVIGINRDIEFNYQKAWHKRENIVIEDGILKIYTKREQELNKKASIWDYNTRKMLHKYDDFDYTTGEIWSREKFSQGKFEARIKVPKGKGFWSAFWLVDGDVVYNEIDIFEFMRNNQKYISMNLHHDIDGDGENLYCFSEYKSTDFSDDYHIYGLIWDTNKIQWLVDGEVVRSDYRYYNKDYTPVIDKLDRFSEYYANAVFPEHPSYLIFNTAVFADERAPNFRTPFPGVYEIDWIRYYQRKTADEISLEKYAMPIIDSIKNYSNINFSDDINIQTNGINTSSYPKFEVMMSFKTDLIDNTDVEKYNCFVYESDNKIIFNFNEENLSDYAYFIVNSDGKLLFLDYDIIDSTFVIDLSENAKTVCFLYLIDRSFSKQKIDIHKIVLE